MNLFLQKILTYFEKIKPLYFTIASIGFICIISIYFVIDSFLIHPLPYPIAVVVTNVQQTTATVTYVSTQPQMTCALLVQASTFFVRTFCEKQATKLHSIDLYGLQANTTYQLYIGKGIRWRSKTINPINGVLVDPGYQPTTIAPVVTIPRDIAFDLSMAPVYFGVVLGKNKVPQLRALVLVRDSQTQTTWSTQTNGQGNFALTLPRTQAIDEVQVVVWGPSGYINVNQPLTLVGDRPVTLTLQSYE